ncbi:MAG: cation-translocating P-type ATPase [Clostridia bacterium]|nr:cation-translocating P-type ATPase [Clostridia bacterium]
MIKKDFYTITTSECLKLLGVDKRGLSEITAKAKLKTDGENKLEEPKKKNLILVFLLQFTDIMIIILLIASALSIGIAIFRQTSSELLDGFIIFGIVLLNAIIGFVQERKAENSLQALKNMTEPETKVVRNGELKKMPSKNCVVGDIIVLEAGDIIPADCRLIESSMLKCDESSLTGESVPTTKDSKAVLGQNTILAERKNMVYSGCVISNGRGLAVVVATKHNTEIGKIANMLQESKKDETPLQKGINQIGKIITFLILAICVVTFAIEFWANPSEPLEAFLTAIAIAVAAIPESLPAVITIIMSLGIARLAKRKAIVKRLHAVETLGSCEIICSDKTGTLTENKMKIQALFYNNNLDLKAKPNISNNEFLFLSNAMLLCNNTSKSEEKFIGDPTEIALCEYTKSFGLEKEFVDKEFERIAEIPFDSNRKLMTTVHYFHQSCVVYTKGAVDELLKQCTSILINGKKLELNSYFKDVILTANNKMGSNALRVLGFAYKEILPRNNDSNFENNLTFVGLAGMIDPPRKEVKKAIEKCKTAGIRPIMITGDHKNTAIAIAKQIGLAINDNEVITGAEIDKMNDEQFNKILFKVSVFARVSPENKVRIVEGYKKQGKIVAMTGDGVNDAPSIKRANIGVGMGITGTDVTKDVADLIVTDDNFATIIIAIEEGRKIYSNIQKTVQFLFSANLAEITAIFLGTILFPAIIFLNPVQILFVNLISDTLPAIALGLEPAEKNIMATKPRSKKANLFSNGVGHSIIIMGLFQGIIMLTCFLLGNFVFGGEKVAMSMAFYALNIIQFFYFISMRAKGSVFKNNIFKNKWAVFAVLFCFGIMAIIALTPIHIYLGLVSLGLLQWLVIFLSCILTLFASEFIKITLTKKYDNK